MSNVTLNEGCVAYDPSCGPTHTQVPTDFQRRAMQAGTMKTCGTQAYRQPIKLPHCKVSGRTKRNFRMGDIISLPYHSANMDQYLQPTDRRLAETCEGWVFSKRRMMIVLWLHADDMFAIPLFIWHGAGLQKKMHAIHEYVDIKNKGK
ncbi:hypothetical protein EJ03DRAFT_324148 [Teratosphaeria nubilosa]|uniref:Uncharacterized protein n=1 Tax=Teratosphaeria nubilosa TaxID=161662 RepID=A0A6G1LJM0_9PEZI|nr:hypothetical protein EJ03DRAFT_324148 [Teratosphaeria nubilosa]